MTNDVTIEYRFAGFRVDIRHKKLLDPNGELVALSARPFDTLLLLLERPGEILSREEMMEAVWPKLFVEENNLTQAISTIRKALNDPTSESRFIRTVPGRGYSFVGDVEKHPTIPPARTCGMALPPARKPGWPQLWLTQAMALGLSAAVIAIVALWWKPANLTPTAQANSSQLAPLGVSAIPRPEVRIPNSIAVLPLVLLRPDHEALFAVGLHDEMISQLTKIPALNVVARSSVVALLESGHSTLDIARVLRVESILSGTLRLAGTRARISLQLLDVISGLTLWSGTYDIDQQDMAEMISVQGDIARNVAAALKDEIPGTETVALETLPAELLKAHRFNLAARNAQTHQEYAEAWRLAQKAIALAPDFYEALDTFTTVNLILVAAPLPGMSSRVHADLALEHANRMIALASERSEGHALRAATLAAGKDWGGAAAAIEVVMDMNAPLSRLDAIGLVLLARGDFERAVAIYEANLVTDLINPYARGLLMAAYELAGRRDTAQARYEMGQELHHQWFGDTVNVLLALGRNQNLSDIEQVNAISDELRTVLAQSTNTVAVRAALDTYRATPVTNSIETLYYAALAARLGEHDSAVELLRTATQDVASALFWAWLPVFDATRQQPSFRRLLRDAGLVAYWQSHGWPRMCQPNGGDFSCDWRAYPPDVSTRL